jgi:hypothetical protein
MAGICIEGRASPPASQPLAAGNKLRSLRDCRTRVPAGDRRLQCKDCVRAGGVYITGGRGRCRGWVPAQGGSRRADKKPARKQDKKQQVIYTVVECKAALGQAAKRKACVTCILDGKLFHRPGKGRCIKRGDPLPDRRGAKNKEGPKAWLKKGAPDIRTPAGCKQQVVPGGQRKRCIRCVKGGGTYRRGACAGPTGGR